MLQTLLSEKNKEARFAFERLPYPSLKYGLDIHTDVSSIRLEEVTQQFSNKKAPFFQSLENGVILCDLETAFQKYPEKIAPIFGSLLSLGKKFEAMHLSLVSNGIFLYLPPNAQAKGPIILPAQNDFVSHVLILAEKDARASLIHTESHSASPKNSFSSSAVEIFACENAHVTYSSIQNNPLSFSRFAYKRAHIEKNASVDWYWSEFGSKLVKLDVISNLVGENASTRNMGLFLGNESQHFDMDASAVHLFPQTKSHLLARGVLNDSSKAVYKGLIKMTKEARGSVGNQRADVLLLSPNAEADPVPALEIEGSDLRCSHAATVGRLDKEKLFYLASRGLDEEGARALYIHGFLEFVLNQFFHSHILHESRRLIDSKLDLGINPPALSQPFPKGDVSA